MRLLSLLEYGVIVKNIDMNNQRLTSDELGWIIVLGGIILICILPALIILAKIMVALSFLGLIGAGGYKLNQYNERTGNISRLLDSSFDRLQAGNQKLNTAKPYGLGPGGGGADTEVEVLKAKLAKMIMEDKAKKKAKKKYKKKMRRMRERHGIEFTNFQEKIREEFNQKVKYEKANLVDNMFEFNKETNDDYFEFTEAKKEIEKDKLIIELGGKVMEASHHEMAAKKAAMETKSEYGSLRADMKVMENDFKMNLQTERNERKSDVQKVLHMLEVEHVKRKSETRDIRNTIALMKERNKSKFVELKYYFQNEIKNVQMQTFQVFTQMKESITEMKLQFGKEILRLDKQDQRILVDLEKYYTKSQAFVNQCKAIANEARSQNIESNYLMNKVETLYKKHSLEARDMERKMNHSLSKIAVREGDFANRVGEALLNIKHASLDNIYALKDIGLERKGLDLAYVSKEKEQARMLDKLKEQEKSIEKSRRMRKLQDDNARIESNSSKTQDKMRFQMEMNSIQYARNLERAQRNQSYLKKFS